MLGDWHGSNGFRLMPADELQQGPASAQLSAHAGRHAHVLAYRWEHPEDGPQDGVLLLGSPDPSNDGLTAAWADSWHQSPHLMTMHGTRADGRVQVTGTYGGGAEWIIAFEQDSDGQMLLTMHNVVPERVATAELPSGPYPVMVANLRPV